MLKKTFSSIIFCCSVLYFSFLGAVPTTGPNVLLNDQGKHFDLSQAGGIRPYDTPWPVYITQDNLSLTVDNVPVNLSIQELVREAFLQWSNALTRQNPQDPGIRVSFVTSPESAIFSIQQDYTPASFISTARARYPNSDINDGILLFQRGINYVLSKLYRSLRVKGIIGSDVSAASFAHECMYLIIESSVANMFSMASSNGAMVRRGQALAPILNGDRVVGQEQTRPSIVFTSFIDAATEDRLSQFIERYRDWLHPGRSISAAQWNQIHEIGNLDGRTLAHLRDPHSVPGNINSSAYVRANQHYCFGRYNISCALLERYIS